ncbi:MAG: aldolase/citrate lyase family protein [Gammaproteobacteria bacterium]
MSEAVAVRTARLPRSWLFVPADSERKLQRVMDAGADAVILDLEDAVRIDRKGIARDMAMEFLRTHATATPMTPNLRCGYGSIPGRPARWPMTSVPYCPVVPPACCCRRPSHQPTWAHWIV